MVSGINERVFETEGINKKIHEHKRSSSSSSSDAENENPKSKLSWKRRLFGRKASVHAVLGGGKYVFKDVTTTHGYETMNVDSMTNYELILLSAADIILWRNKPISGGIVAGATVIWLLFEWIGYHLLAFICHFLILSLAVCFIWSNAASFVSRPPKFPEVILSEDMLLYIVRSVTSRINVAFATYLSVASGNDVKKFFQVIGALWIFSLVGSWFSFWTLAYLVFLMLYTAPVLYEKYEVHVDTMAEKALLEFNKHYAAFDEKVLRKIPRGPFSDRKQD
ncbi:hypothetical protein ZIOFF_045627 [Zingiber officinale]|uniref:Reticulon-like protein n=1 Tax=Zingiber officinale TaxID=94328 RepID=A0A8J5KRX9_ZINOF|nr:hypothetical protein ZIOFF_045627 [Zingiber officinale]